MDNVELSLPTRWGMVATGLVQGLACYLLISWLSPIQSDWIFYGIPTTVAISSVLLFSVVSFKQKRLWGWLAIVGAAVLAMSIWLKRQSTGMDAWGVDSVLWNYGSSLLLMSMLLLPWIQQHLNPREHTNRYTQFYGYMWQNGLTLLVIFIANLLVWLVLLLWGELFKLVGITFFNNLFFETDSFICIATSLITAVAVILARTQLRLMVSIQKLLTLIATGLLPLVSLLTLLFIATLPFTGVSTISRHVSAAGLLSTLAFLLLALMAVVRDPQKNSLPYTGALRCLIKTSLLVSPVYALIAAWALWLRVSQYGWTPDRLHGVLAVAVLLVWSLGYCISMVRRKKHNPLWLQGYVNLAVSLLALVILVLLHTPLLDSWRISVNSHMARYHSGKIKADDVTLSMLEYSGRLGRAALESLKNDAQFMQDAKRKRNLLMALNGGREPVSQMSAEVLAKRVLIAPGSTSPDIAFWRVALASGGIQRACEEDKSCMLVSQDLNDDGQPEQILFTFTDGLSMVFAYDSEKKAWSRKASTSLPEGMTKETLLRAINAGELEAKVKPWRDLSIGGERLDIHY